MTKEEETQPLVDFEWRAIRRRQRRLKQFQCCTIALLITAIVAIIVSLVGSLLITTDPGFQDAVDAGTNELNSRDNTEALLLSSGASSTVPRDLRRHQSATHTSAKATLLARHGYAKDYASRHFGKNHYNGSHPMRPVCNATLSKIIDSKKWSPIFNCTKEKNSTPCPKNTTLRYRSMNGTCNNLDHSDWGAAMTPFRRSIPPWYQDGISAPRTRSSAGASAPLPPALEVSTKIHRPLYRKDPQFTVMLAVWGQFLDHDITATAASRASNGIPIQCCPDSRHPECFPVWDTSSNRESVCMEFVRSAPAPSCCLGPRDQLNQVTAYIDGSMIYGADDNLANSLRANHSGLLNMLTTVDGRDLLPASHDKNDGCNREKMNRQGRYCFMSGDARSNENLHLTSIHLIFARQHNQVAMGLAKVNPKWSDEKLFQEARHIVAAQVQHITYTEFLPVILGDKLMKKYDLDFGKYTGYNKSVDSSIANEFAAAAFRFAHTLIPGLMRILANDTTSEEYVQIQKMLFNPYSLYDRGELNIALKSAMHTDIEASDPYFTDQLKTNLFQDEENTSEPPVRKSRCGLDLVTLNIQRGRDHGLAGYPEWRKYCKLQPPRNFEDLLYYIDSDSVDRLSVLFDNVNDVDLYTGALVEPPLEGSLLGPTATCLIVEQFRRLKYGDRFWYENNMGPQSFTKEQLKEIKATSLASIICENADNLDVITPEVMKREGPNNINVACKDLKKIDYEKWRED